MRKGFTLIELLVVVLIIGILAAIALPMYNKAVEKSRAMQRLITIKALIDAQERYELQNGSFSTSLEDLDIDILSGFALCNSSSVNTAYLNKKSMEQITIANPATYGGRYMCVGYCTAACDGNPNISATIRSSNENGVIPNSTIKCLNGAQSCIFCSTTLSGSQTACATLGTLAGVYNSTTYFYQVN